MNEAVFAVYILMHVVFTQVGDGTQAIKATSKTIGDYTESHLCVNELRAKYRSNNYDLGTNSFGCIRVVHPQHEELDNQRRQQRNREGSGGRETGIGSIESFTMSLEKVMPR